MQIQKVVIFIFALSLFTINIYAKDSEDINSNIQINDNNKTISSIDENLTNLENYKKTSKKNIYQFVFENDFISGSDAHYTNGLYYSWLNDENIYLPSVLDFDLDKKSKSITISHIMFTPQDLTSSEPINTDIPYAGYLGLNYNIYQYDEDCFHELGVSVGIVGKHAYAKESQKVMHKIMGNTIPQGWDTQLGTHYTAGLSYQFGAKTDSFDLYLFELDLSGFTKVTLGELYSGSRIGFQVRIGNKLKNNFPTSGDFLGGLESRMLNYENPKGFTWFLTYGNFYNKVSHFYIVEASDYYEIDNPDYVKGYFLAYNIGYDSFNITLHAKTDYIENYNVDDNGLKLRYGGVILSWEF